MISFLLFLFFLPQSQMFLWNLSGCPWCSGVPIVTSSSPYILTYPSYHPSQTIVISTSPVYRQPINNNVDYRVMQPLYNLRTNPSSTSHLTQYYGNNQPMYYQQPSRSPYQMSYQELSKRYQSASGYNPTAQQYQTIPYGAQMTNMDNDDGLITNAPHAKAKITSYGRAQKELLSQMSNKRLNHHQTGSNSMSIISEGHSPMDRKSGGKSSSMKVVEEKEGEDLENVKTRENPKTSSEVEMKTKIEEDIDLDYPEKGGKEPEVMQAASLGGKIQKDDNISNEFVPIGKDKEPTERKEDLKMDPLILEKIKKKLKEKEQMVE